MSLTPSLTFKILGETLIAYRIYKGLSQQELVERLGVAASQVLNTMDPP